MSGLELAAWAVFALYALWRLRAVLRRASR